MKEESLRYLELLEKRITMLTSLAGALLAARSSLVSFDIDALEARVADQEHLCQGIRALDDEIEKIQYQCAAHLRLRGEGLFEEENDQVADALHRLHRAQADVKKLNASHQAVLRRSSVTISALLNSIRLFEGTYQQAARSQTARQLIPREQV